MPAHRSGRSGQKRAATRRIGWFSGLASFIPILAPASLQPMYLKNVLTLRVCSSLLTDSLANLSLPRSTLARPWTPARAPGVPHRFRRWRALASSGELGTVFSREGTRPSVARPRLRGEAPARPRGPGGCTETARDVHRVHRHQGPHAPVSYTRLRAHET